MNREMQDVKEEDEDKDSDFVSQSSFSDNQKTPRVNPDKYTKIEVEPINDDGLRTMKTLK
jgi:hypothetical protein